MHVDDIKTRAESAYGVCNQHSKLQCDEPLSNSAFDFNLRSYISAADRPAGTASQRQMAVELRSALHVCQITACTLPRDEYANGRKNNGAGPSGGRRR